MNNLYDWAKSWNIPPAALHDLINKLGAGVQGPVAPEGAKTEAGASKHCRLQASQAGDILWRNNVGQVDPITYDGKSVIRFGLANDTKAMNKHTKSSDLIGIRRVLITQDMVGTIIGQFLAREVKTPDWSFKGTARENAQLNYLNIVITMGGDGAFTTGNY